MSECEIYARFSTLKVSHNVTQKEICMAYTLLSTNNSTVQHVTFNSCKDYSCAVMKQNNDDAVSEILIYCSLQSKLQSVYYNSE